MVKSFFDISHDPYSTERESKKQLSQNREMKHLEHGLTVAVSLIVSRHCKFLVSWGSVSPAEYSYWGNFSRSNLVYLPVWPTLICIPNFIGKHLDKRKKKMWISYLQGVKWKWCVHSESEAEASIRMKSYYFRWSYHMVLQLLFDAKWCVYLLLHTIFLPTHHILGLPDAGVKIYIF